MVVKIKMKHFALGLIIGLIFFLGPGLIGDGGLLGSGLFSGILSLGILGIVLAGILYAAIGGVLYGFILRIKMLPQIVKGSISFFEGALLAYLAFWIVGLFAFSNFGF